MKTSHCRILVADDLPSIHDDYRKILLPAVPTSAAPHTANGFFPAPPIEGDRPGVELDCHLQGETAIEAARAALAEGRPYRIAFLDVRMPPGIDGVETARRLRDLDPELQVVLCTAHADFTLADIGRRLPESDGLLILKKPFDPVEIQQLARSLDRKWLLARENRELLRDLENKVRERTAELTHSKLAVESALEAAEAASRAKSEFLANISHEIRTPLNAIVGMAELLSNASLESIHREQVETIRASGDALLSVINQILDFSRIQHGGLELERTPFDLPGCLRTVVEMNRHSVVNRPISLTLDLDPAVPSSVVGDSTRLRQIFLNLVGNAVKITECGEVSLSVRLLSSPTANTCRLRFVVRDTGIGIPAERVDRLFQPFSQIDASTTRRYGGTGLGLAITRRLVHLLNGTIEVASSRGEGTSFTVELTFDAVPVASHPAAEAHSVEPGPSVADRFPLRVLIVEDNAINRRVAQLLLDKLGYTPAFAVNGKDALAVVARDRPDLVFMDVQMPVMDGLEATRRLIADYPPATRPWIVAMTANAMEGDRDACLQAGMDDYTSKPVRLTIVAEAIARAHAGLTARRTAPDSSQGVSAK